MNKQKYKIDLIISVYFIIYFLVLGLVIMFDLWHLKSVSFWSNLYGSWSYWNYWIIIIYLIYTLIKIFVYYKKGAKVLRVYLFQLLLFLYLLWHDSYSRKILEFIPGAIYYPDIGWRVPYILPWFTYNRVDMIWNFINILIIGLVVSYILKISKETKKKK